MQDNGYQITADQIRGNYPFEKITISGLDLQGYQFSFELDMKNAKALNIKRTDSDIVIPELNLAELNGLAAQIRFQEEVSALEGGEQ